MLAMLSILYLLIFATPGAMVGVYMIRRRGWPLRRLAPFNVAYASVLGVVLGAILQLRGWDLVVSALIGAFFALLGTLAWSRALGEW
jgi:hypothetical protein